MKFQTLGGFLSVILLLTDIITYLNFQYFYASLFLFTLGLSRKEVSKIVEIKGYFQICRYKFSGTAEKYCKISAFCFKVDT